MPGPRRDRIDFGIVERGDSSASGVGVCDIRPKDVLDVLDVGGGDVLLPFKKRYVGPGLQIGHGFDAMSRTGVLGARVRACNDRIVDAFDNVLETAERGLQGSVRMVWFEKVDIGVPLVLAGSVYVLINVRVSVIKVVDGIDWW